MGRFNSRRRKKLYKILAFRDGEECKSCKRKPPEVSLVIHHEDNNPNNNSLSNISLHCRRCNYFKNPRMKQSEPVDYGGVGVGEDVKEEVDFGYETSISISREKEPQFYPYVDQWLDKSPNGEVDADDLELSSAWDLKISQRTTARYLKKACSSAGPYEMFKDGKKRLVRRKKR